VETVLLLAAAAAVAVAVIATAVALRAGRRARRAADLVSQLLEPPVLEGPVVDAPVPERLPTGPVVTEQAADQAIAAPAAPPAVTSVGAPLPDWAAPATPPTPATPPVPATAASLVPDGLDLPPGWTPADIWDTDDAVFEEAVAGPLPMPPLPPVPPVPPVVPTVPATNPETAPVPAPATSPAASGPRVPAQPTDARPAAPGDRDPQQARIPVLDLDRLRGWLTQGDLDLGRVAVVSVELDNLAHVQERLGYAAGAHLLEAITTRLRTVTRPRDVVAHVNQERFVLVCRDVPDDSAAQALAERIAMGVAHPSVVLAGVAEVTASIGVALAFDLGERPEAVLRRAITAGNQARSLGGARIEISTSAPTPELADGELLSSVARDELRLHYLPIVSSATGRVAGFEALVRWDHPAHGLLFPHEFLPEAERTGAIVPIGAWALDHGCRQMAVWHDAGGAALKLDVNLSARQFADPGLTAQVKQIVHETGLAPGSVWLEITEETLLRDRALADTTLGRLHDLGVRLVIDDFGTGASSLMALKHFPIDAIKIARPFVADLGRDRDSDAICGAIIDLAHSLGISAIAEGVETLEQFSALRSLGCELAQGHLFGPARPAEAFGPTPAATLGVMRASDH
jgi:diguanylate cyclase (GGDEF)-like protein